ncbi:MAG: MaoC family dehydratase N-terminal domain-containing protein [Chloroflexi bacterium]|nr:MaoC family dehydratase N-terminal domain-containing protein [Chloroflexota bacterium]
MAAVGVVETGSVGRFTIARSWELTPRLISAFAAGVDDPNPCYMDDVRDGGLVGHPGMAFTFQWNSRHIPDETMDLETGRMGVHAWADIRYARPFRQGDVVTAQAQTIEVRQIPPGVLQVQRVTMRDSRGEAIAVMDTAGIIRGARTNGPDRSIASLEPQPEPSPEPGSPVWVASILIAPHAAHVYTECADIWNPIHTERSVALAAGLPDIILHGSATMTIALREVVNRSLGGDPARVARLAGQFRAMVIPGEEITVRSLEERETPGGRAIFFDVLNAAGQPAIHRGLVVGR